MCRCSCSSSSGGCGWIDAKDSADDLCDEEMDELTRQHLDSELTATPLGWSNRPQNSSYSVLLSTGTQCYFLLVVNITE